MLYCFDKKLSFDYSKREMNLAKVNNNGILYDSNLKNFFDFEGNLVDITDKIIFPRTGVLQIYEMNNEIINHGGIPIVSNSEIDIITNWPNYYSTQRKVQVLRGKDLIDLDIVNFLESDYGKYIFIKTKEKNFSGIIPVELLKDSECAFYKTLEYHLDDEFIVSEKIDVLEDDYGLKEYRCFVVNGEVYNISRFTTNVFHKVDNVVFDKANSIIEEYFDIFPSCYVVDLFEYSLDGKNYIDVVEFNPIHSSGIYLYNSCMMKNDDLLHSNIKCVSKEFVDSIDGCSNSGLMINDRENLYDVFGGFSNDLRSICLTGDVGLTFAHDVCLSVSDFASHKEKYDFENLTPLTDEDLIGDEELFGDCYDDVPKDIMDAVKKLIKSNKK